MNQRRKRIRPSAILPPPPKAVPYNDGGLYDAATTQVTVDHPHPEQADVYVIDHPPVPHPTIRGSEYAVFRFGHFSHYFAVLVYLCKQEKCPVVPLATTHRTNLLRSTLQFMASSGVMARAQANVIWDVFDAAGGESVYPYYCLYLEQTVPFLPFWQPHR